MEQFPVNTEGERSRYDSLKEDLLSGTLSLEEVRAKLMEWDQETSSRDASDENLVFLYDSQIVEYIHQQNEAIQKGYQDFLSFTEFHVGQRLALNDIGDAREHFKKAIESAEAGTSDESWLAYIKGSLLYLEGKEIPEELIEQAEPSKNALILRKLNEGLKERGTPSYAEDYGTWQVTN